MIPPSNSETVGQAIAPPPLHATALVNARLIDPASGYDGPGSLIIADGLITEVIRGDIPPIGNAHTRVIDCEEKALIPGLIDLRVRLGDDGLAATALAAAKGGVTSIVLQPDTDTGEALDSPLVHVYTAGAATKGDHLAEIGLGLEAGTLYVTDVDEAIANARLMRNLMTYATGFNALIAHRPKEASLAHDTCASEGELAMRMGLNGVPAMAERIMLERDLALVELTGARLLVDQVSTREGLDSLLRAKARGLEVAVSASINHLVFNEIDISDYRSLYRFDPPLGDEDTRAALCDAVMDGLIDIVTSNHTPLAAQHKQGPFVETLAGAIGLQTLLPALIGLYHDRDIPLLDLIATVTINPAQLLGLPSGKLEAGAPADLTLVDIDAPLALREKDIVSKSKNTPFENRTLTGRVLKTLMAGRIVYASL